MLLNGNLTRLCREILAMPVLFPAFGPEVDTRNIAKVDLKRVDGGYHITRRGLLMLLTNTTYLGWWTLLGEVISKDNHPAIVDEGMFWYAFHRLSEYTVDGEKNERAFSPRRYEKNGNYDAAQALLKDIISTQNLGAVYVTGSKNRDNSKRWYYGLFEKELGLLVEYHTALAVSDLDEIFVARLLERLRQTVDFSHYRQFAQAEKQRLEEEHKSIKRQLQEVEKLIAGTFATLQLSEEELDTEARKEIAKQNKLFLEQKRLFEKKLSEPERVRRVKKLLEYDSLIERVATTWHQHSFEDRKALVEALTETVLIDTMAPHWFRVIIKWRNPAWGKTRRIFGEHMALIRCGQRKKTRFYKSNTRPQIGQAY